METFETGKEALAGHGDDPERIIIKDDLLSLPPGFRFHPTDEEIILHYLIRKVSNNEFVARAIGEVDLNKVEPWDLPQKAKMGEKVWWFFCQRDRKYPTGMRTNRATESGYWKATGKDKEIFKGKSNFLVGMKKTLVFYRGRAPKGEKSNWVMHEYRLEGQFSYNKSTRDAEWVVCRVFHKSTGVVRGIPTESDENPTAGMDSFVDNLIHSPTAATASTMLPALKEVPAWTTSTNFLDNSDDLQDFKPVMAAAVAGESSSRAGKSPFYPTAYMQMLSRPQLVPTVAGGSVFYPQQLLFPDLPAGGSGSFYSAFVPGGGSGRAAGVENAVMSKQLWKMDQSSHNNVSGSQETGLSMEVAANAETTSALSKAKQIADDQSSPRPFDDLDGDPSYHDGDMEDDLVDPYAFWDDYGTDP